MRTRIFHNYVFLNFGRMMIRGLYEYAVVPVALALAKVIITNYDYLDHGYTIVASSFKLVERCTIFASSTLQSHNEESERHV